MIKLVIRGGGPPGGGAWLSKEYEAAVVRRCQRGLN
jgi:hypothetical protein